MSALITRRQALWLPFASSVIARCALGQQTKRPKLNVLFIAVDDLNNRVGCYGDPLVKTPNLDRLAGRGVRFERSYCQYPLCNPSRTSLLSGRRPEHTQIFDNYTPPRTHLKNAVFLPEYFHQHGYYTARVGKIAHGRYEDAVKWDLSEYAMRNDPEDEKRKMDKHPPAKPGKAQKPGKDAKRGKPGTEAADVSKVMKWQATDDRDEDTPDGRTARRIVQLMEQKRDRPFFIGCGFHKPHLPWSVSKKYLELYPPDQIPLPPDAAKGGKMDQMQIRQAIAAYFACISFMDAQLGVVLDGFDRLKLGENTIIVLFGDNGFHLGEHARWKKSSLFEESARVPLIVAAPGKSVGAVCPRTVEFLDLFPTLTDLAGLPAAPGMEGVSLTPLLADPNRPWNRPAFTIVRGKKGNGRSVRTERYRYTEWDDAKPELYDHEADPGEYRNLADDPRHAKTVAEMRSRLTKK